MKLMDNHEYVGTLESYVREDDCIKLVFVNRTTVELPLGAIPKEELDECIDKKIGIFNNQGDYRLRKYSMPIEHFKNEECPSCNNQDSCIRDGEALSHCLRNKTSKMKEKKTGCDNHNHNKRRK